MRGKRYVAKSCLVAYLVSAMALGGGPLTARAAPGDIVENGTSTGIIAPGFLFEPEVPFTSLKNVPTWNELEQLLDNPYLVAPDPATPGNDQGFPSYRATGVQRRHAYGVTLPPLLVHPLNYNPTTGEEMRLLNPRYGGGTFNVTDRLVESSPGTFTWMRTPALISPGSERIEQGAAAIDYNNPVGPDLFQCVTVTELNPPEGSILCGGDPGEPGYAGFGVLQSGAARRQYSVPAVPGIPSPSATIPAGSRLYDPDPTRGTIVPRNTASGVGGLRKPSLRVPPLGTGSNPGYHRNTDPNAVAQSNENDYVVNREVATALGKALFWDMQVGSDGVQSCGTCHFNGTGTDTRTRNQINPNHLGGDLKLAIGDVTLPDGSKAANYDLKPSDFPLRKLRNPDVAADPLCTGPRLLVAHVNGGILENMPDSLTGATGNVSDPAGPGVNMTVCDKQNLVGADVNDVVSSMGVHFGLFADIAPIGQFVTDPSGVNAVAPERRVSVVPNSPTADPIPAFAGTNGNEFRRVEPRNTPTMQGAAFHFDNFWDGRARHDFNGGSVFGAADPQKHVFVTTNTPNTPGGTLVPTRQIIRFASIASLATGPGLSEFEMSFQGRNWAKIGKKLLQAGVTPLANQLVDPSDSVLGPYSGQRSTVGGPVDRPGRPGLNVSYPDLVKQAFYPGLWQNTRNHLNGCYTDDPTSPDYPALLAAHPNQCSAVGVNVAVPVLKGGVVASSPADPFDKYVLSIAPGPANPTDTNQFTQMEGNFSLFWGLAVSLWVQILVPDDTPFDQFLDGNPGAFMSLGEPGEPGLVPDLLNCGQPGADPNYCFTEFGNFKRDPGVRALQNPTGEGGAGATYVPAGGTRQPTAPDPLLGLDIFFASNLSLKNPNFRTARCGECHALPTLTDHTMPFTSKINLPDAVAEFSVPGVELVVEPLARLRVITGFLLEAEINENGQDAVERRFVDQSVVPNPVDGLAYPGATAQGLPGFGPWTGADAAFLDNGIYNLGLRPIAEDIGRGGNDAFGWPLSLTVLMMKNLAGPGYNPGGDDPANGFAQPPAPGIPMPTFDPEAEGFGLFEPTAQDQQINPGYEGEPANPLLPAYLGMFVNNITVGDFPPEMDEAGGAIGGMVNTLTDVAMIEGFMDTLGPFNPANVSAEVMNFGGFSDKPGDVSAQMGTWPNVNRVGRMGSFKAPPLRNVELTGPYFHNGGMLTLRQVVDFYTRGGDFPLTNAAHRDFNLVNMNVEVQSNLSEAEKVALVDFLLELTDERNRFDRQPFDHPEVIIPIDGLAPDNTLGRANLLGNSMFRRVPEVGAAGQLTPEPTFLNVTKVRLSGVPAYPSADNPNCNANTVSHYCH